MIRRYASHLLYLSAEQVFRQYVVELHQGIVHDLYPLSAEMPSVVWLGGIIVLSHREYPVLNPEMDFPDLIASLTGPAGNLPLYAFSLKGVNLADRTLTRAASLARLG